MKPLNIILLSSIFAFLSFPNAWAHPLIAAIEKVALTDYSKNHWNGKDDTEKNDNEDAGEVKSPLPNLEDGRKQQKDHTIMIEYDLEKLPSPVKLMRQKIIDAAKTGDVDNLKTLLGNGRDPTQLSVSENVKDPIGFIKQQSGDGDGLETLAILIDLLNSGYVHLDEGIDEEIYVWPYFVAIPLDELTKPQLVQLFQIMTAGDLEQMKEIGTYAFYRIGITPDGQWRFFMTGD